ncbi:MAG: hypothetical protein K0S47_998 [Herbinix sp.]|nr:hypothetical protein [Herbinix sp.]
MIFQENPKGDIILQNKVIVKEKTLQENMYYKDHLVLKYVINYPQFISDDFETLLMKLNGYYKTKAYMYLKTNVMNLYQMSMVEYEYSVANQYPIRTYEAYVNYEVTYNMNMQVEPMG